MGRVFIWANHLEVDFVQIDITRFIASMAAGVSLKLAKIMQVILTNTLPGSAYNTTSNLFFIMTLW